MRLLERILTSLMIPAALAGCGVFESRTTSIVVVTIDTLRADRVGCYGYGRDTSPAIDAFAREGILFENAISVMGTTLPAHVSLFTATGTVRHGIKGNVDYLRKPFKEDTKLVTFAQMLKRLGYTTAGFVSATPLKPHSGIALGFDHYDAPRAIERPAGDTTERVIAWLQNEPREPFFLWVHYFDPHTPYRPPPPYDSLYRTDRELLGFLRERRVPGFHDPGLLHRNNLYDGEIRYTDDQLARLFEALRARGNWDELAVVVTSDHGEGLGQHDWLPHGRIYNEQLFVPLIFKLPGPDAPRGERSGRLASLIDVLPTLVSALDLPLLPEERAQFEGVDLQSDGDERDYLFVERTPQELDWHEKRKYALLSLDWKYFHRTWAPDELYDMQADRIETRNVIEAHPELADQLRKQLLAIVASDPLSARGTGFREDLPPELLEELRALGYVE